MSEKTRAFLRSLPSLTGDAPPLGIDQGECDPVEVFLGWLEVARSRGVSEPHTMTLSTVDARGIPDARVLVLKDVDDRGWAFASTRSRTKGEQLADNPSAALTFWWPALVRSVRVRGSVVEASREESLADLQARSPEAQAGVDVEDWVLWRVVPERVEFWQGSTDRRHVRVIAVRDGGTWHWER